MECDLAALFGKLGDSIPTSTSSSNGFLFSSKSLPIPLEKMYSSEIIVKKSRHGYNSYFYADSLQFYAQKNTYRHLALLILSVVFHKQIDSVQISLIHPMSDIKNIIVEYKYKNETTPGYHTYPQVFSYYPDETEGYAVSFQQIHFDDLPCFWLTNAKNTIGNDDDWAVRDHIRGFGNDRGNVRFAELLLNASLPTNEMREYHLEGEYGGRRCVGWLSAEAQIFLPGSFGWNDSDWL